jgi:ABC-2 type transport system ATP-binding protein
LPILHCHDVAYRYPSTGYRSADPEAPWAVDGITVAVERGETLGLLGPNGAGKSTLLALIAGLRAPARGTIERPPAPRFALVPQDNAFYPMLTCRENLMFFAGVSGVAPAQRAARVAECIELAALQAVAERRADQCSGGVKRRLNLAIGLLADPDLLLLDEPTVNVDAQARAFLLDLVRALRARGKAIVYASHYMEEVQAICDRIVIVDAGRVIASGTLAELLGTTAAHAAAVARDGSDGQARNLEELFLHLTHRSLRD